MRLSTILFSALLGMLGAGTAAQAQGIPGPVRASIQNMDEECRGIGGTPGSREGLLMSADIDGDGVRDWITVNMAYRCEGAGNLYGGSGGGDIAIWKGRADGGAEGQTYITAFGARVAENRAYLRLASGYCTEVGGGACDRLILWNGREFEVGPVAGSAPNAPTEAMPGKPGADAPISARASAAPAAAGRPPAVQATIREMEEICRQNGGSPPDPASVVLSTDITGDGIPDWVINQVAYECQGTISYYGGSRGGSILVFRGTASDAAAPEEFIGFDAREADARIWLSLAGTWCGQTVTENTATVDLMYCERPLVWNGERFDIDAAPSGAAGVGGKPGAEGGSGVTRQWFVGVWVPEGGYCDSGAPFLYAADGTMQSEFIEGRWRLEGDVLFEDYTYQEDYEGPRVPNSVRTRLTRLGDDRFRWTALDGSQSGVYDRCPPN